VAVPAPSTTAIATVPALFHMPPVWARKYSPSLILVNDRPATRGYAGPIMPTHRALISALLVSLAVAGCSQSEEVATGTAASSPAPVARASAAGPAAHDGRKIEVTANDTMKFSIVEIRAKRGERLSVTLVNDGTTPKFSMGHNWVLITTSADVDAFLFASAESAITDYVSASKRGEILAATKLLGPGERDTTTFAAPSTPGRYPFLCSFPGHAQVGMRGVLIVE
jgi:azurin